VGSSGARRRFGASIGIGRVLKTSNDTWQNPHDPDVKIRTQRSGRKDRDAKIGRTKQGSTRMIDKPEHVLDLAADTGYLKLEEISILQGVGIGTAISHPPRRRRTDRLKRGGPDSARGGERPRSLRIRSWMGAKARRGRGAKLPACPRLRLRAPRHPSRSGEHPKAVPHQGRGRQPVAPDAPSFEHRHTQAGPGGASWPCFRGSRGSRGSSGLFHALPEPVGAIFRPE
jgi:hypothetical protein